jgi:hypothetical protein
MKNIRNYDVQCMSLGSGVVYIFKPNQERWCDDWMGGKYNGILQTIRKDEVEPEIIKIEVSEPIYSIPPENIIKIEHELKIIENPDYQENLSVGFQNIPEDIVETVIESTENLKNGIVGEIFDEEFITEEVKEVSPENDKLNTNEAWYKKPDEKVKKKKGRKPKWQK